MPKRIIPKPFGGVLSLKQCLEENPSRRIVVYDRMSSTSQSGSKKEGYPRLRNRTYQVWEETREEASRLNHLTKNRRMLRVWRHEVVQGKMRYARPELERVAEYCKQYGAILAASSLNRFIRAEDYHRHTNIEAMPTEEEFAQLRRRTRWVPLATLIHPGVAEGYQHSQATKRSGKAGRPPSIPSKEMAWNILSYLGNYDTELAPKRWEHSIKETARKYGVSAPAIKRLLANKYDGMSLRRVMGCPPKDGKLLVVPWTNRMERFDELEKAVARIYER